MSEQKQTKKPTETVAEELSEEALDQAAGVGNGVRFKAGADLSRTDYTGHVTLLR